MSDAVAQFKWLDPDAECDPGATSQSVEKLSG